MSTSTSEIPPEAAYLAARDRALRTTEALVLAEGQVLYLSRKLAEVTAERDRYATEAGKAAAARARRRMRDRARRSRQRGDAEPCEHVYPGTRCDWNECREGVDDASEDSDPVGYTSAVGQAD